MTTLAADAPRTYSAGDFDDYPVVASDIIYQGAAVGLVAASGHARPLVAGDRFVGFAESKCDNSTGAAAAVNVRVIRKGVIKLPVTGALITDRGQPVYAQDDNAFSFTPVAGSFVGLVTDYVSAGVVLVEYGLHIADPWAAYSVREAIAGTKLFDAQDCGKLFCCTEAADADALTLPAVADGFAGAVILYVGPFGGADITIAPHADDMILGPDITGANDKDLVLTKATARRGDYLKLGNSDADGYHVTELRGTWARQG
jgi:hypothetical protein